MSKILFERILVPKDGLIKGPFGGDIKKSLFVPKTDDAYKVYEQGVVLKQDINYGDYYISKEHFEQKLKRFQVKKGDILMTGAGTLGELITVPENAPKGVINQALLRIRLNEEIITSDFFKYYFKYYIKAIISRINGDSVIPNLPPLSIIKNTEIDIPNLNVQEQIAKVLSSLDSKIELNNKINAELEAMAKTIYDYWFVQFDFPNEKGKPYKTSGGKMVWNEELKRGIPVNWKSDTISELFEFNSTLSIRQGSIASYVDMDALPTEGYMTKEIQKKEFKGGVKFQNGDLVIARITPCLENGKTGLITLLNDNEIGFGSTEFIVIRGKKMPLSCFASFLSRSDVFRKYAITNMTGTSGRKRVDAKSIEKFKVPIPSDDILLKFEGHIAPFFSKMTSNTRENQQLASLRDWLLPMLMNGQVKVGDAEKMVAEKLSMAAEPREGYKKSKVR